MFFQGTLNPAYYVDMNLYLILMFVFDLFSSCVSRLHLAIMSRTTQCQESIRSQSLPGIYMDINLNEWTTKLGFVLRIPRSPQLHENRSHDDNYLHIVLPSLILVF